MPPAIFARLSGQVMLEARGDGEIAACFEGYAIGLGKFSAGAADCAQDLRAGLPLTAFSSGSGIDKEIDRTGPAVGQTRSVGVLPEALGKGR